jgi:hypothetical protein
LSALVLYPNRGQLGTAATSGRSMLLLLIDNQDGPYL